MDGESGESISHRHTMAHSLTHSLSDRLIEWVSGWVYWMDWPILLTCSLMHLTNSIRTGSRTEKRESEKMSKKKRRRRRRRRRRNKERVQQDTGGWGMGGNRETRESSS